MSLTKMALALVLAVTLAGCSKGPTAGAVAAEDMSLGDPNSKIVFAEYASVGCPICARWYNEVYPAFKTKYIDSKRVNFVAKEMLVGGGVEVTVASSGFLMARCAGKDKYFAVIDALYKNQEQAFQTPRETLVNIARSVGMSDSQFEACINDEKALQALNDRVEKHNKEGVDSTPTFVINGKKMEPGFHSLEEIDAAIKAAGG
jgi:protein-disulfide isomerase